MRGQQEERKSYLCCWVQVKLEGSRAGYCWDCSYQTSLKTSFVLYCGCCDSWELDTQQWLSSVSPSDPHLEVPVPSPALWPTVLSAWLGRHFLPLCCMVSHRQFILARIWALKPAGDWGYHKKMYPPQWVCASVIRARGWKTKCQLRDVIWLHGDT